MPVLPLLFRFVCLHFVCVEFLLGWPVIPSVSVSVRITVPGLGRVQKMNEGRNYGPYGRDVLVGEIHLVLKLLLGKFGGV